MSTNKHIIVGDWAAGDIDPERKRLGRYGITLSESEITRTDSVEEKHAKLKAAIESAPRIDALMFCIAPVDNEIINLLPETCQLLQRCGTGLDNVDMDTALARGITVRNTPQYCVEEVAVHAMSMLFSLHRQLAATQDRMLRGEWSGITPRPIRRLSKQTLGILGFGRIGRKLAEMMRPLVDRIVYYDDVQATGAEWAHSVSLEEVLRTADLISLHLPATEQTRHIVNDKTLTSMKDTTILVNAARGSLVDAHALVSALNEGRIAGAGLDVFEPEIPPDDSPLRTAKNILLTSHSAWYSEDSTQDARVEAVDSVVEFLTAG